MKSVLFSRSRCVYLIGLLLIAVSLYVSVIYSKQHFRVDSDLNHLVKQDAPWRENLDKTTKAFGDSESSLVVVISGDDRLAVQQITQKLAEEFSQQSLFKDVFAPSTLPWFKNQALWFLPDAEFNQFKDNVSNLLPKLQASKVSAATQPANPLAPSMQFVAQVHHAVENQEASAPLFIEVLNQLAADKTQAVNWFSVLLPQNLSKDQGKLYQSKQYQIITLNAEPQRDQKEPNKLIMQTAQNIIAKHADQADVQIRLTGQTALDYDEIQDANSSVKLAGTMSLIGLIVVLGFGIRSLRIILASYAAVIVGLVWTLALGLWLVGSYNTISIVFLVMFIGLGVDFSIHFCLRIREEQLLHSDNQTSLIKAFRGTWLALSLCALTSAIGFLGFYPTDYTGLAELGIISAAGMLMGLLATFVVIPVFFFLFGYPKATAKDIEKEHEADEPLEHLLESDHYWLVKHHKLVIGIAAVLLVVMGWGASQMRFDFSTLVLKSPQSESVQTLEEIQKQGLTSSYQMMMLADSTQQAQQWQQQLVDLPEVSNAISIHSFLPKNQQQKMAQLGQAMQQAPAAQANPIGVQQLVSVLEASDYRDQIQPQTWQWLKQSSEQEIYISIAQRALQPVEQMQQQFGQMMQSKPATIKDIPAELAKRYHNKQYSLVVAYPSGDMRDVKQLDQFIQAVQKVAPNATGRPVAEQQVGKIITRSFIEATCYSLSLIALVLLFALKYKRDVVLSFIPLLLTTLSTMAIAHWTGFALNMANIIVIPLIFGLGVDNGIHIVERFREVNSVEAFYQSSTPKAAILSSLTTIVTFGSLLFADHRGMFSIGFLLTIAIGFLLLYSLTVLPAFLFKTQKKQD
ncbi:MAG: MMPL family transporter [Vibrio sp.]